MQLKIEEAGLCSKCRLPLVGGLDGVCSHCRHAARPDKVAQDPDFSWPPWGSLLVMAVVAALIVAVTVMWGPGG